MAKTILILGAGIFQVPAIIKAKEMGLRTVVLSYYPDDPGMALADNPFVCSTTDLEGVLEIAKQEKIDGIITIASEVAAITVGYVAERLKLPGLRYDMAHTISNKYKLRKCLSDHNIKTPRFGLAVNYQEAVQLFNQLEKPVFMKPTTASGSSGVFRLLTLDELEASFQYSLEASIVDREVIMEELLTGKEVGGELLVRNGEVIFFAATRKYLNEAFVPYGHLLPSELSQDDTSRIVELLKEVISNLGLVNGPLNFDIMLTPDGPVVIELGGRLGGNCLPQLMYYHTGNDLIKSVINIAMGNEISEDQVNHRNGPHPVAAYILGSRKTGRVASVKKIENVFPQYVSNLIQSNVNCEAGDQVIEFSQGRNQLGYFIFKNDSPEKLMEMMDDIHRVNWFEID
jgi:biotin carboxylase